MPRGWPAILCLCACGGGELGSPPPGDEASSGGDPVRHGDSNTPAGDDERIVFDAGWPTLQIRVDDSAKVATPGAPVTGGIPLGRGVLAESDVSRLALADAAGNRVAPLGAHAIGRWADGSVKWLLLEFPSDIPIDGGRTFTLGRLDAATSAGPAITVEDTGTHFVVDTGVLRARLPKAGFGFLDGVWLDADGDGQYATAEQVVAGPGELYVDLDDDPPGAADAGVIDYPDTWSLGIEGGNWLRDSESVTSTRYLASTGDYSIELFRQSDAQVVFKIEGMHRQQGGIRQFGVYTLYVHFYYDSSSVRVGHTWVMTGEPANNFVRRMALDLPFDSTASTLSYAFGGPFESDGTPVTHNSGDPPYVPIIPGASDVISGEVPRTGEVAIVSIGPDKYYHDVPLGDAPPVEFSVYEDQTSVAGGIRASGWGRVSDASHGMAMGVRDFWREHPKEVQYRDGRMGVFIWPDHGGKTLDLRRRYSEVRGTVAEGWGLAARREFVEPGSAVGVAKSTDLLIDFASASTTDAQIDSRFRRFQDPLRPFVSGAHNVATGIFGPLLAYNPTDRPQIENYLDLMMARIIRTQQEYAWVGMYDYGDYLPEFEKQEWELNIPWNPNLFSNWGYAGWLQENYRFGQWAFVQYFRSGRNPYFRAADTWLRHARDVDCVFWESPDDGPKPTDNRTGPRRGGGHRHDQQHWGTYMTSYGIPSVAVVHHYYLTGEGRDLDAMRDYVDWLSSGGSFIENYGEYSVLYMGEALGDATAVSWAMAHDETPQSAFGRATLDSGMGLMMHDIHTAGAAPVRAKLRIWADLDEATAAFLRGYIEGVEGLGTYSARIAQDWDAEFPAATVAARRYEQWADRVPVDFRDAFSADIMPEGPWTFPLRTLESIQFDGPGGMGNDLGRHSTQMTLMWLMHAVP